MTTVGTATFEWIRYWYLAYWSKPVAERVIYRWLWRHPCRLIVEVGVGDGRRAERVLRWLAQGGRRVRYAGIDLFELNSDAPPECSLKNVYRRLSRWASSVRLVPGTPAEAIRRVANDLMGTDLLIFNCDVQHDALEAAWLYVPRMLTDQSLVLALSRPSGDRLPVEYRKLEVATIRQWAERRVRPVRRAA
ncbi:MAG: hypothetical protein KatS3mg109_1096 [Pirellulaceae bacterium]|nr:MAG: hypothetical protein KatS3mg109_1096 [Pirellulaceae bacterium]GIW93659.1 MAG: hypothetical protein KatS3mg110_1700 [Pirellulaceae bacterium]